ncbi:uncharacterized protein [Watersipora subatra]|uniref:uncharacterized protein n=1 Tax=Watersipora subatra TaxID=2589382 RepID=UPI00355ADEEB
MGDDLIMSRIRHAVDTIAARYAERANDTITGNSSNNLVTGSSKEKTTNKFNENVAAGNWKGKGNRKFHRYNFRSAKVIKAYHTKDEKRDQGVCTLKVVKQDGANASSAEPDKICQASVSRPTTATIEQGRPSANPIEYEKIGKTSVDATQAIKQGQGNANTVEAKEIEICQVSVCTTDAKEQDQANGNAAMSMIIGQTLVGSDKANEQDQANNSAAKAVRIDQLDVTATKANYQSQENISNARATKKGQMCVSTTKAKDQSHANVNTAKTKKKSQASGNATNLKGQGSVSTKKKKSSKATKQSQNFCGKPDHLNCKVCRKWKNHVVSGDFNNQSKKRKNDYIDYCSDGDCSVCRVLSQSVNKFSTTVKRHKTRLSVSNQKTQIDQPSIVPKNTNSSNDQTIDAMNSLISQVHNLVNGLKSNDTLSSERIEMCRKSFTERRKQVEANYRNEMTAILEGERQFEEELANERDCKLAVTHLQEIQKRMAKRVRRTAAVSPDSYRAFPAQVEEPLRFDQPQATLHYRTTTAKYENTSDMAFSLADELISCRSEPQYFVDYGSNVVGLTTSETTVKDVVKSTYGVKGFSNNP